MELKRCYNCGVELPFDARLCPNCKIKVGKRDKLGRAKAPVDWKAYTICIVSWFIFGFFIWWGFFRKG
jgi:predicted amidophosphoribosyltransferase